MSNPLMKRWMVEAHVYAKDEQECAWYRGSIASIECGMTSTYPRLVSRWRSCVRQFAVIFEND